MENIFHPYSIIYRVFCEVLEEAGIDPAICMVEGKPWEDFQGLSDFKRKLNGNTTVVHLPCGADSVLGEQRKGLDLITYTESRMSMQRCKKENKSVIYCGLDRCGLEAARLHERLLAEPNPENPCFAEVEPDALDIWKSK